MKRAVFVRMIAVVLLALVAFCIPSITILSQELTDRTAQDMLACLRLIDSQFDESGNFEAQLKALNNLTLGSDTRLTLINSDGTVLADTSSENIEENHLNRAEVISALSTGEGYSVRKSDTLHIQMLYAAILVDGGARILRLAVPFSGLADYFQLLLPVLAAGLAAAGLAAWGLARGFSARVTRPLREISEKLSAVRTGTSLEPFPTYRYEELNVIAGAAAELDARNSQAMEHLRQEQQRIEFILGSMDEGLVLLDGSQKVLTLNSAAAKIFGSRSDSGQPLTKYTRDLDILNGVEEALAGRPGAFPFRRSGKIYRCVVSQTDGVLGGESGVSLLMEDMTAEHRAQQMRQDFFSDASHELKTPITSISGYVELLQNGMYRDEEQQRDFLARIGREAANMTALLGDILTISRLESETAEEPSEPVDFAAVVRDVAESLAPLADDRQVSLETDCPPLMVTASPRYMRQVVQNLLTNGLKYNRPGGHVVLAARAEGPSLVLLVADNGIGIPEEAQGRVFERFYRVDKGRSRKQGGTGLGLAIVKHVAVYYGGSVGLESKLGIGTTFTVTMPIVAQES